MTGAAAPAPRAFAIVPAAGRSVRMGQPKLLLPWGHSTVIEHVLAAWRASLVDRTVMVVHSEDLELASLGRAAGVDVVVASPPPPDMKDSVLWALRHIAQAYQPHERDAWLLAPADLPMLSAQLIDRVLAAWRPEEQKIVVPRHGGRRGHPVLFPWSLARAVADLADDEGVNRLLERFPLRELDGDEASAQNDLDTPDDYRRLRDRYGRRD